MEGWKKSLYFCVIFLLGIFFGWILSFISEDKKKSSVGMSEINVFPGHSYSLLIDNERFPLDVHPYEKIKILIKPGKKNKRFNFLPPRVQIPYTPKEEKMSVVRENRFLFRYDTPNALKEFRLSENLDKLRANDDWVTARRVMNWARKQFEPSNIKIYPSQNALILLHKIRSGQGQGFCAQYCYLTVQALQSLGYIARYVTIRGHEICEVWLPDREKWVVLDSYNEAFFINKEKKLLSALDIFRASDTVQIVTERKGIELTSLLLRFKQVAYWLRNDLYTTPINIYDLSLYKVHLVGENIAEIIKKNPAVLITVYPEELYESPRLKK